MYGERGTHCLLVMCSNSAMLKSQQGSVSRRVWTSRGAWDNRVEGLEGVMGEAEKVGGDSIKTGDHGLLHEGCDTYNIL